MFPGTYRPEVLFGEAAHLRVDRGDTALQLGYAPFAVADVPLGRSHIEGGNFRRQKIDGRFKLLEPLAFGGQETDCEVANTLRDLIAQDGQRPLTLGCDENATPGGEVMADYIRDRVSLPGSGRSLHDHSLDVSALEALDDSDLLLIEGLGEKELADATLPVASSDIVNRRCRGLRTGTDEESADARNRRDVGGFIRGFRHEGNGRAWQGLCGFDRFSQALEIGDEEVIRARTRVKRPSVSYNEIWTRFGYFAVVSASMIGMIAACPVELGAGIAKDRSEGFSFEWRKLALRRELGEMLTGEARDKVGAGIVHRGKGLQDQYRVDAARAHLYGARFVQFELDQLLDDGVV